MPFYQFLVHGRDEQAAGSERGFWTTRHAFGVNQEAAADKVLSQLAREFTTGASAPIWNSTQPILEIDDAKRIGWLQARIAPNKGSVFYGLED
jgi:hypothetical protein